MGMFASEMGGIGSAAGAGAGAGAAGGVAIGSDAVEMSTGTVSVDAGIVVAAGTGAVVRLKAPEEACEVVDGSDAGRTPPLGVVLQRPWQTVPELEVPLACRVGRPVAGSVVEVVVVSVVVVPGAVVVSVVVVVPGVVVAGVVVVSVVVVPGVVVVVPVVVVAGVTVAGVIVPIPVAAFVFTAGVGAVAVALTG